MPFPLLVLALSAFGIGTTEFVIMGLLPEVATDLGVTNCGLAGDGLCLRRCHRCAFHGDGDSGAAAARHANYADGYFHHRQSTVRTRY